MSFLYWIPDQRPSIKLEQLNALGLGYALEQQFTARGCSSGPDGRGGVVVCHGDNKDGRLGYFAEQQTWKQVPGSTVSVGVYTDALPTPDELVRRDIIDGCVVAADDGSKWIAPTARKRFEEEGEIYWTYNVPRRLTLAERGEWVQGDVKPRYQRLWKDAIRCEAAVLDREDVTDLDDIAVRALQTNYRVSAVELDILGVYDESFRMAIIHSLIDMATWMEWLKKKALATDGESS